MDSRVTVGLIPGSQADGITRVQHATHFSGLSIIAFQRMSRYSGLATAGGVFPALSIARGSAPALSRTSITAGDGLSAAATCSGVEPALSFALTSAPALSRT